MREVVIVEAVRTPLGRRDGALSNTRPDELAGQAIEGLLTRVSLDAALIEDVILGCVTQIGEQGWNIARLSALIAGLPVEVPAVTINRMCGSGQQAMHFACQAILSGDIDIAVAGGVESMSRVKMGSDGKDFSPRLLDRFDLVWQGTSAELMAKKFGLSRHDLDAFSLSSHERAIQAINEGRFQKEIVPVSLGLSIASPLKEPQFVMATRSSQNVSTGQDADRGKVSSGTTAAGGQAVSPSVVEDAVAMVRQDEGPRADTSIEKLAGLKTVFDENGVVTAGNSSQISDGASMILLMARGKANELGLKPRARVVSRVVLGSDPILMLDGVIPATRRALSKANLTIGDIDCFEINEAFACVPLAWAQELKPDMNKVNRNGGAIALGHPLGASGARLMTTLLHELERTGGQFGLQTMCIGHGMATATVIERL